MTRRKKKKAVSLSPGYNGGLELAPVVVDDPFEKGEQLIVMKNTRTHPLDHLLARGHINVVQFTAGNSFLAIYEQAEIGGAGAIDYSATKVDTSFVHRGIPEGTAEAVMSLAQLSRALGRRGYAMCCKVIGARLGLHDYAGQIDRSGLPSHRTKLFVHDYFRSVLDDLADHFGSAVGKPTTKVERWGAEGYKPTHSRGD